MLMISFFFFHETGSLWHHENIVKIQEVFVGCCKTCMACMKHSASLLRQGLVRELIVFCTMSSRYWFTFFLILQNFSFCILILQP